MRINSKYISIFAGMILGLTACSSEDLTSPVQVATGKTVNVTLTVDRSGGKTRTVVGENPDGLSLYSEWVDGDELLVVNSANQTVGGLKIESVDDIDSEDPSKAVFKGNATLDAGENYTLVYLGGTSENGGAYAEWTKTGLNNPVITPDAEKGFSVSGLKADLCRADLMLKEEVQFFISGENAYPAHDVVLEAQNAMARFSLTGVPETLDDNAELTVSYTYSNPASTVSHTITGLTKDTEEVYLPMPTGKYSIFFCLSNGSDSYTASIKNGAEVTVTPLYYVDTDDTTGKGKGIGVELRKTGGGDDDEVVGPAFVITVNELYEDNGVKKVRSVKKYAKFTRANLHYDSPNRKWYLPNEQTSFLNKAGMNTSSSAWSTAIDLIRWGATGYNDGNIKVYDPTIKVSGDSYLPYISGGINTDVQTMRKITVDANQNVSSSRYCDWGYVYGLQQKMEESNLTTVTSDIKFDDVYYTLTTTEWKELFSQYVHCLATVNNVKGMIMLPCSTLDEAQELLKTHEISNYSSLKMENLSANSSKSQGWTSCKITEYSKLKDLNAVFFPAAGHHINSSTSAISGDMYYWTATEAGTNGQNFYVSSDGKTLKFNSNGTAINGGFGKCNPSSVRLVKIIGNVEDSETVGK